MIAKRTDLLENLQLLEEAEKFKDAGFLSPADFLRVKSSLPIPKTSRNLLVRLGFFLLGCLLYSSIVGFLSLLMLSGIDAYEIFIFIFALIGLCGTEFLCSQQFHKHGIDDAFVMGFQALFCTAIGVVTEQSLAVFAVMAIFGLASCIRYVNTWSMLCCLVGISGFFAALVTDAHIIGTAFLPFLMFFLAVGFYRIYMVLYPSPKTGLYRNSVAVVKIFSFLLGYLSVNYLVVRELSQELLGVTISGNNDIPFAWLFYGLTFIIPAFYLYYSLRTKDRPMLYIGLLSFGFSVFTIRYYYSIMPLEIALILGGAILFGISWFCIGKLKHRETGITFEPDKFTSSEALAYAQAAIVNSHAHINVSQDQSPMPFGGGGFSGGGAGETF